jgi:hypothetical protein
MSEIPTRKLLLLGFTGALLTAPAVACAPWFPNQLLFDTRESLTWAPVAGFRHEIDRIALPAPEFQALPPEKESDVFKQSEAADLADLRAALDELQTPQARKHQILADYKSARASDWQEMRKLAESHEQGQQAAFDSRAVAVPAGLPQEFEVYLKGVHGFLANRMDDARSAWQQVLQLPPDKRRYRTIRAQFMIGKSWLGSDPAKAIAAFQSLRTMAKQGARDSLGLACASIGWEARAELDQGHDARAIDLYLAQYSSGDSTAVESLATVCQAVLQDKDSTRLRRLAADPHAARVITAYVLTQGGLYRKGAAADTIQIWLAAVEDSSVAQVIGADRMAWTAYQSGNMPLARRWVDKAPPDAPVALWVRAKLLLRDGKTTAAARTLAKAAQSFPPDERWDTTSGTYSEFERHSTLSPHDRATAELGALQLARGQYVDALDHLLKSGWWLDAAYIAERILTEDELIAYTQANAPEGAYPALRHLLARRLTRAGRWKEARPYFPEKLRPRLDAYIDGIRAGHNLKLTAAQRAQSLWTAATVARNDGMDLLATELVPDSFADNGAYPGNDMLEARQKNPTDAIVPPSPDEIRRVARSAPQPLLRFHYRYIAADHAWAAAKLMPDESDALARLCCEAGGWLKAQDPQAADRFYKLLVTRCATTALGRAAAQKKWFPDTPKQ